MKSKRVLIAIQARSTSTRLPGKHRILINGISILERVILACEKSMSYINNSGRGDISVSIALLVPSGDSIVEEFAGRVPIIEGSENDVLSRYNLALKKSYADYIVRITADCPMIPPFVITKHIINATKTELDYVSNVDPRIRTAPDGWDAEVISKRALTWAAENAKSEYDKEHVTAILRDNPPAWLRVGCVIGYSDHSNLKISIDTEEDLLFVRTYHDILNKKLTAAKDISEAVFRL